MASASYSFLDIAVLDGVRERFAAGDALALLSADLRSVLWANGNGAQMFGYADIETAMGEPARLTPVAQRQIQSLPGYPRIGRDKSVAVRIAAGMKSQALLFRASAIALPDGQPALLFALPAAEVSRKHPDSDAALIGGLTEPGRFAALIGADGEIIAASPGFGRLGIGAVQLTTLVAELRNEGGRLVKRHVEGAAGRVPAGLARLSDEPARYLLIVVDDSAGGSSVEPDMDARPAPAAAETETAPLGSEAPAHRPNSGPPLRFTWRTDADGRLSAISPEFAALVGERADAMVGRALDDIAEPGFGPPAEIAGLMQRRETWSGRTVMWPEAGSPFDIPVDLAALPVYRRDRSFDGFRGFGVARPADAAHRPAKAPAEENHPDPQSGTAPDPSAPENSSLPAELPQSPPAPPQPDIDASDKIIRLSEHRTSHAAEKGLSSVERSAFREIGDRLKSEHDAAPAAPAATSAPEPPDEPVAEIAGVSEQSGVAARGDAPDQASEPEAAAPPLAKSGFLPSAFAGAGDAERADPTALLNKLPIAALVHHDGTPRFANPAFLDLSGYASVDELAAAGGLERLFGEPDAAEQGDRKLRLVTKDGAERPVAARLQTIDWQGSHALLLTLAPDEPEVDPEIVEQRLAQAREEAARDERLHHQSRVAEMGAIVDTATDGIVLITPDGLIRSISRPAEALFGLDSDTVVGQPFVSLFAIESQRAARDYLAGLTEHGVASVLNDGREVIGREAKGRFIPLFMTMGRLPKDSGFCAVLRDITPWKRAEEELTQARAKAERASSEKTDFLARVSHEIRTPLNAIIGFSELMIDEKFGPVGNDRYRDYLRDINRSGNHVLDLVNDLLDISKIEAGQQEMSYEAVSLNDTLSEIVAMMQPQANRERVIIRSSLASRVPEVVADLRSVRQIALNLLSNAVRYTLAGGQVIVSTAYEPSGDVVIRVRDTGIGMTAAEIEQALKPFKQLNALRRDRRDGTGLGLPLTKAMVEANRARFSIASTPGEGTLVEVAFPSTRVLAD